MAMATPEPDPCWASRKSAGADSPEAILDSFDLAWRRYREAYIELQDQLCETLRAAKVQWLAAIDQERLGEVNRLFLVSAFGVARVAVVRCCA
jgi:hypothetical protein